MSPEISSLQGAPAGHSLELRIISLNAEGWIWMSTIRMIAHCLFPTESQVVRLCRWLAAFDDALKCLEPVLWGTICVLLVALYARVLF